MIKVALLAGHSVTDSGAVNKSSGQTEYNYNSALVERIERHLRKSGVVEPIMLHRTTYSALPGEINSSGADLALEFHCNAFNSKATGTEMLYWHTSGKGKALAESMQKTAVGVLSLANRGAKPINANDRGGYLLRKTTMPTVIVESLFIDNDSDLSIGCTKLDDLAAAYAKAIEGFTL